jgi:hypothetical protein
VNAARRQAWKLGGVCILAALIWQQLYGLAVVDRYHAASPPAWLRQVHFWLPDMLAARILNVFGFRFDIQNYSANTTYVIAADALEAAIWAIVFYGVAHLVGRVRRSGENAAAA